MFSFTLIKILIAISILILILSYISKKNTLITYFQNIFYNSNSNNFHKNLSKIFSYVGSKVKNDSYVKTLIISNNEDEILASFKELEISSGFELKSIDYLGFKILLLFSHKGCIISIFSFDDKRNHCQVIEHLLSNLQSILGKNCIHNIILSSNIKNIELEENIKIQKEQIQIILKKLKLNIPCYVILFKLHEITGLEVVLKHYLANNPKSMLGFTIDSYDKDKIQEKLFNFNNMLSAYAIKDMIKCNVLENEELSFVKQSLYGISDNIMKYILSLLDDHNKINILYIRGLFFINNNFNTFSNLLERIIFDERYLIFTYNKNNLSERNPILEFFLTLYALSLIIIGIISYKSFSEYTYELNNVIHNINKIDLHDNKQYHILLEILGKYFSLNRPSRINPIFNLYNLISHDEKIIKEIITKILKDLHYLLINTSNNLASLQITKNLSSSQLEYHDNEEFNDLKLYLFKIIKLNNYINLFNSLIEDKSLETFYKLIASVTNTSPTTIAIKNSSFNEILLNLKLDKININNAKFQNKFRILVTNFIRRINNDNKLEKWANKFKFNFDNLFAHNVKIDINFIKSLEEIYQYASVIQNNLSKSTISLQDVEKIEELKNLIQQANLDKQEEIFFDNAINNTNELFKNNLINIKSHIIKNLFERDKDGNIISSNKFLLTKKYIQQICNSELLLALIKILNEPSKNQNYNLINLTYFDEPELDHIIALINEENNLVKISEAFSDCEVVATIFNKLINNISTQVVNNLIIQAEKNISQAPIQKTQYTKNTTFSEVEDIVYLTKVINNMNSAYEKLSIILNSQNKNTESIVLNRYIASLCKTLTYIEQCFYANKQKIWNVKEYLLNQNNINNESIKPINILLGLEHKTTNNFIEDNIQQIEIFDNMAQKVISYLSPYKKYLNSEILNVYEKWSNISLEILDYKNNKQNTSIVNLKNIIEIDLKTLIRDYDHLIEKFDNSNIFFNKITLSLLNIAYDRVKYLKSENIINHIKTLKQTMDECYLYPLNKIETKSLDKSNIYDILCQYHRFPKNVIDDIGILYPNVFNAMKCLENLNEGNLKIKIDTNNKNYTLKIYINDTLIKNNEFTCNVTDNIKIEISHVKNNYIIAEINTNNDKLIVLDEKSNSVTIKNNKKNFGIINILSHSIIDKNKFIFPINIKIHKILANKPEHINETCLLSIESKSINHNDLNDVLDLYSNILKIIKDTK